MSALDTADAAARLRDLRKRLASMPKHALQAQEGVMREERHGQWVRHSDVMKLLSEAEAS